MKTLGSTLKNSRELSSMTLKQVEAETGISNAYLSQLENDKIKKPSASVLYKLATVYKLDLNSLLEASGIIKKTDKSAEEEKPQSDWLNRLAFYAKDLNSTQQEEVLKYLNYIKKNV
jgi:transcriptional regulator with XRE-family HTH domain